MIYLRYLWYLLRHKWWVFVYGRRLDVTHLALLHDLSKFGPAEFGPYARWFYGPDGVRGAKTTACKEAFDRAWGHHKQRNKHHWEWWCRDALGRPIPMRDDYRREMLADWHGAGRAINGVEDTLSWYRKNRDRIALHQRDRDWVEEMLGYEATG